MGACERPDGLAEVETWCYPESTAFAPGRFPVKYRKWALARFFYEFYDGGDP
jgi:hypothetical protein